MLEKKGAEEGNSLGLNWLLLLGLWCCGNSFKRRQMTFPLCEPISDCRGQIKTKKHHTAKTEI